MNSTNYPFNVKYNSFARGEMTLVGNEIVSTKKRLLEFVKLDKKSNASLTSHQASPNMWKKYFNKKLRPWKVEKETWSRFMIVTAIVGFSKVISKMVWSMHNHKGFFQ